MTVFADGNEITLHEGDVVVINGSPDCIATIYVYSGGLLMGSNQISASGSMMIGPFSKKSQVRCLIDVGSLSYSVTKDGGLCGGYGSSVDGVSAAIGLTAAQVADRLSRKQLNNHACAVGDSISDMCTDVTSSVSQYAANGYLSWALLAADWGFYFDNNLNFAATGATLDGVGATPDARTQVASAIASNADTVVVLIGTNNLTAATTADEMFALWRDSYMSPLIKAGKQVVALTIPPRDSLSSANLGKLLRFNQMLQTYGNQLAASDNRVPRLIVAGRKFEDFANATAGNTATGVLYDGTHPTPTGAYYLGYEDLGAVMAQLFPPRPTLASSADVYSQANNPSGSMFSNPSLKGTAGNKVTSAGLTPTGNVADSCRIYRGAGSSTATMVGSKVAASSLITGYTGWNWQRIQVALSVAGSATETYVFSPDAAVSLPAGVVAGDTVQLAVQVWVASATNLIGLEVQMVENGPASPRQGLGMVRQSGYAMPFPTGKLVTLKTHPLILQSGTTSISSYVRAVLDGSSTSAAIDFYIASYALRKII